MAVFSNGLPFIGVESNGVLVAPFAQKLNIIGAQSVARQSGANGDTIDIDVSTGGGGFTAISGAQISLTTLRNANETGTLTYDTEDFDTGGWANIVANATQFTVPAGITHARLGGQIVFATNVTGAFILASQINNAPAGLGRVQLTYDHTNAVSGSIRVPYIGGYMPVSAGDTLRIQTTGPDTTIAFEANGSNYFYVEGFNFA